MMHASATRRAASDGGYVRLQRRCACGASAKDEQCESCKANGAGVQAKLTVGATDDPFEREADAMAARVMSGAPGGSTPGPLAVQRVPASSSGGSSESAAPPQVEQVLASPGQPLDAATRAFFEPRFGHDFSAVRVHRDAAAADSARRVSARAYTAGEHVVFGQGQYAPGSAAGRALLAHELTHVLQQRPQVQRATLQRDAIGVDPEGVSGEPAQDKQDEDERKRQATAPAGALQRSPLRVQRDGLDDDPLHSSWPEKDEADAIRAQDKAARDCLATAPKDKVECEPDRALTWADFTGTPDASNFGAMTFSGLREREINIADRRCQPAWAPPNQPARGVQAYFTPSRSWVRARYANAGDSAANGCDATVAACHADFAAGNTGFHLTPPVPVRGSPGCPAGVRPAGTPATQDSECDTVVGVDCNTTRMAESMRLLNHEQWHFSLSCAMAKKANAMLATTPDFDALLSAAQAELSRQQTRYDGETAHGCNAGPQASWQTDIAAGLPGVTITVRPAAPRRRR